MWYGRFNKQLITFMVDISYWLPIVFKHIMIKHWFLSIKSYKFVFSIIVDLFVLLFVKENTCA